MADKLKSSFRVKNDDDGQVFTVELWARMNTTGGFPGPGGLPPDEIEGLEYFQTKDGLKVQLTSDGQFEIFVGPGDTSIKTRLDVD